MRIPLQLPLGSSPTLPSPPPFILSPHHQVVATGLQSAEADAEKECGGEGVVVYEAAALSFAVAAIQRQVGVSVAREEHGTKVDLQRDGLDAAVDADVPLTWMKYSSDICLLFKAF